MIDSNVALPRRSEIAADDYDPLPCRCDPFLQASCGGLSQRSKIVRQRLKRKELGAAEQAQRACDSLRMLSRISQKSVDNFVI
jgi:hypothetical protein